MLDAQKRRRELVQADIARYRPQPPPHLAEQGLASGRPGLQSYHYERDLEHSHSLEEEQLTQTVPRFPGGSRVDPFRCLPQFSSDLIDAERLQYLTHAYFPSLKRSQQYVNTVTSSPIVFLADAHPGIILQDALDNNPRGGVMTIAAKTEIYTLLNKRLRSTNPGQQLAPDVIAGVFNLILLEMSYGDLDVVSCTESRIQDTASLYLVYSPPL